MNKPSRIVLGKLQVPETSHYSGDFLLSKWILLRLPHHCRGDVVLGSSWLGLALQEHEKSGNSSGKRSNLLVCIK